MELSEIQLQKFNEVLNFSLVGSTLDLNRREVSITAIRRRAEALEIYYNEDDLNETLLAIENAYRVLLCSYYNLSTKAGWKEISEKYLESLNIQSRDDLIQEIRRLMFAKYLQLNKFIASWDEVESELSFLGVI